MKRARNQLILLGFICLSLSWEGYLLLMLNVLLWIFCLSLSGRNIRLGPLTECALLIAGCVGGYALGMALGRNIHFSIGHGLTLLQAARLLRQLNYREQFFSILIAIFHIGVACTFVFDLRFIPLLALTVLLVPKAFVELAAEPFQAAPTRLSVNRSCRLKPADYALIVLSMVFVFMLFPRVFMGNRLAFRHAGGANQGTMLDSVLDPTLGRLAQSSRALMHIEGERIGYLRCFSLVDFDGTKWSAPKRSPWKRLPRISRDTLGAYQYRRVQVNNALFLGRILPTDDGVVNVVGNFFRRAFHNSHGGIECDSMWNTPRNLYEFWIDPKPRIEPLLPMQLASYTNLPPQSERILSWLNQALDGVIEPLAQARKLESYLRDNFTYSLGAPELSRLNPTEDFLFNQQQGHCERFAATLTLLLRLQGIPSRIVIGYVPTSRNFFSGGYTIRFKDAHAWTEAYFTNAGWVQLDATPRANYIDNSLNIRDLLADLDFAWSSYVVNFDASMQNRLLSFAAQSFGKITVWASQNVLVCLAALLLPSLGFLWRNQWRRLLSRNKSARPAHAAGIVVGHYYGQMLNLLARQGFHRKPCQTPYEFLRSIQPNAFPAAAEVEMITDLFCAARYGNCLIPKTRQNEIEHALKKISSPPL